MTYNVFVGTLNLAQSIQYYALSLKRSIVARVCVITQFTCHTHTNYTCFYSPAARRHRPLTGTHCAYPRRDGQAKLTLVAGYKTDSQLIVSCNNIGHIIFSILYFTVLHCVSKNTDRKFTLQKDVL